MYTLTPARANLATIWFCQKASGAEKGFWAGEK
jgi:hypothetical protein